MPPRWSQTVETHRDAVRHGVLDAAAALIARGGLRAVTMVALAETAGIGRATLYKYFGDVDAVLLAWHRRTTAGHLDLLRARASEDLAPEQRLVRVLETYIDLVHRPDRHGDPTDGDPDGAPAVNPQADLAAALHHGEHMTEIEDGLHALLRDLLADAAAIGALRGDVPPDELAHFCRHALGASGRSTSPASRDRLLQVVLQGLRPAPPPPR